MKKCSFVFLVSILTVCTFFTAFISVSAVPAPMDTVYSAAEVFDSFGNHPAAADEYFFDDGRWTVEYYDTAAKTFAPMTAYFSQSKPGWKVGWSEFYTASSESVQIQSGQTFCCISSSRQIHPGSGAAAVLTFVAPTDGVVSYKTLISAYGNANTQAAKPENYGTELALWVNETKVWPTDSDAKILTYDLGEYALDVSGISVKTGDRVRLSVGARNGDYQNKGLFFGSLPLVMYTASTASLSSQVEAPSEMFVSKKDVVNGDSVTVSWNAVKNAVGYYVYRNGEKVNDIPINLLSQVVSGTVSDSFAVTAVGIGGTESALSPFAENGTKTRSSEGVTYRLGNTIVTQNGSYSLIPDPVPQETKPSESPVPATDTAEVSSAQTSDLEESVNPEISFAGGDMPERQESTVTISSESTFGTTRSDAPRKKESGIFVVWSVTALAVIAAGFSVTFVLLRKKKSAAKRGR